MINFWLALRNPMKCQPFKNIWVKGWKISSYKYIELQFSFYCFNLLEFKLDLNWRQTDHAGPWITVNILGYTMDLRIADVRHWDDDNNTWASY